MRHALAVFLLIGLSLGMVATQAQAQDATDLSDLGYPELNVTVTDDGFEGPDTLPSGRYLVTLTNQGTMDYEMSITGIADGGPTLDELFGPNALPEAEGDDEEIPEWLIFNGGVGALDPGTTGQVIVDLTPGDYFLFTYLNEDAAHPLVVTEGDDPTTAPEPPVDGTITMTEHSFTIPETLTAGPHVFKVENTGEQWHVLQLFHLPDGFTLEMAVQLLSSEHEDPATVPAEWEGFDLEQIYASGGIGTIEPGATTWIVLDLLAGTYGAACFVEDENGPHYAQGMATIFTVA